MEATIVRPSPDPACEARPLSLSNGRKIRSMSLRSIIAPVLATVTTLTPSAVLVLIQISPGVPL